MSERNKQTKETKKEESKMMFSDSPKPETESTLRQDVERKREEIKNSTIGGF